MNFHFKGGDNMLGFLKLSLKKLFKSLFDYIHNILFLAGLLMIAVAGFMFNTIVGLIVSGIFLIIIAFMLDKNSQERGDK